MKKHRVTPLESMEIEFADKTIIFTFDMQAIAKLQNKYGALGEVAKKKDEFEVAGILLWSGVKDDEFTEEEAQVILSSNAQVLADTLAITFDSIVLLGGKENEKKLLEEIARLTKTINVRA